MNVQNIQIAQSLFLKSEERFNSRKENVSLKDEASLHQINVPDAQEKAADGPKVSSNENPLAVVYPPFFPIGNTQDILSIKKVNLTGEDVKSKLSYSVEEEKTNKKKEINNKEMNMDANVLHRHNIDRSSDHSVQVKHITNPGNVLDLKI